MSVTFTKQIYNKIEENCSNCGNIGKNIRNNERYSYLECSTCHYREIISDDDYIINENSCIIPPYKLTN